MNLEIDINAAIYYGLGSNIKPLVKLCIDHGGNVPTNLHVVIRKSGSGPHLCRSEVKAFLIECGSPPDLFSKTDYS